MVAPEEVQTRFVRLGWQYLGRRAIPDGIEAISAQLLENVLGFYELIVGRSSIMMQELTSHISGTGMRW
jgi:hypothetical protein